MSLLVPGGQHRRAQYTDWECVEDGCSFTVHTLPTAKFLAPYCDLHGLRMIPVRRPAGRRR